MDYSQNGAAETASEAAVTAPDLEQTTGSEAADTGTSEEQNTEPRVFTQEEVDRLLGERLAKEQRKWKREQAQPVQQPAAPVVQPPDPAKFSTLDEYTDALADFKANHKIAQRESEKRQVETQSAFEDREFDAKAKYSDYDAVARNPDIKITPLMATAIYESEIGPDVAYHLGKNPAEAARIAALSPLSQVRELGKIEASLIANPPTGKKASSAPEPLKPVGGGRSTNPSINPTDPKSTKVLTPSEWIAARNKQVQNRK